MDKLGGRVLEASGKVTGRTSHKVKGKAARGRGAMRRKRGSVKEVGVIRGLLGAVSGLLLGIFGLLKGLLTGLFKGLGSLLRRLF
jgi:hypothetical protein